MKSLLIRKATPSDYEEIKNLCRIADPEDYLPDIWPCWLSAKNATNFVAQLDDCIVGCVYGEIIAPHEAWGQGLRVHKELRKRGIGTELMTALEEDLIRMGAKAVLGNIGIYNESSLATMFKLNWRIVSHINRRQTKPQNGFHRQPVQFPQEKIIHLVHHMPVLASNKKLAYFKRAYFSMNDQYLDQALNHQAIRVSPDGQSYAIMDFDTRDPAKRIWVVSLAGSMTGIGWLFESFMGEAGLLGMELVVDSPEDCELQSLMDDLHFEPAGKDGKYVVVKKELVT